MKIKQLVIMVALAAVLGGAAWYLNRSDGTFTTAARGVGAKVIEFPLNDVSQLVIQSPAGAVSLVKKADVWKVQERADYPANFERIHGLLTKLWDLKTVQEVKAGASQFARLELAEPLAGDAAKIELKDKDGKALGALILGKKHMKEGRGGFGGDGGFPAGRYVRQASGTGVSLISETLDDVEAKPEAWLAREFIKIENPTSVTLAGATDAQKWKLTRDSAAGEWKLPDAKDAEKLDTAKAAQVSGAFAFASFADALNPDAKPADTGLDKPVVITFETSDRFTYVLKAGKVNGDNQPVTVEVSAQLARERTPGKDEKPEDKTKLDAEFATTLKRLEEKLAAEKKFEGRPFLIAKTTMEQIIKDRAALLVDKQAEPAPGAPAPVHGAALPIPPRAPISVTTPPVAIPALPKAPAAGPSKPEQKPVPATTSPAPAPPPPKSPEAGTAPKPPPKPETQTNPAPASPPASAK